VDRAEDAAATGAKPAPLLCSPARTPEQIAKNLRTSDLAERIPTGDVPKLARDIEGLDERDRYLLACRAEGKSEGDIASHLFLDQQTVKRHFVRIVKRLSGEGETRDLAPHEREILLRMLEAASFAGASDLREQVPHTRVVVENFPPFLHLDVLSFCPPSEFRDGHIPVVGYVEAPDGDHEGQLLIWVTGGYLSALEFAWVTDEMPDAMPPPECVRIVLE
jgi:DNA-binding CsgD family transcriptional regulator